MTEAVSKTVAKQLNEPYFKSRLFGIWSFEIRSHILPLGSPLFLFEFPVLFQILHVDQELEKHQQQEADEEHTCHRACDDSDNAGGFWTLWRGEKSHKLLHRHVGVCA